MLFHPFRSGPPILLGSECGSRFCFPRSSRGPLQNRRQYHTFGNFCSRVSQELLLRSRHVHLGALWHFLKLCCPPRPPLSDLSKPIKNTLFFTLFVLDPPFCKRVSAVHDFASRGPLGDPSKPSTVSHFWQLLPQGLPRARLAISLCSLEGPLALPKALLPTPRDPSFR